MGEKGVTHTAKRRLRWLAPKVLSYPLGVASVYDVRTVRRRGYPQNHLWMGRRLAEQKCELMLMTRGRVLNDFVDVI